MSLTDQEIFDECVSHVLAQGVQAYSVEEGCQYLTECGTSCALGGPLVKRGLYTPEIEGSSPNYRKDETSGPLHQALGDWGVTSGQYGLLLDIQGAHDLANPDSFLVSFKSHALVVAERFNLNPAVLS